MRRLLLSLGLALVVGGSVLGAAATLTITAPPLSAGETIVASCDEDGADVYWSTYWNGTYFQVAAVAIYPLDDRCYDRYAEVVLTHAGAALGHASIGPGEWSASGPDANFFWADFLAQGIHVSDVDDIHVEIH